MTDAPPPENAPGSGSPAVPTLSAGARTPGRVVADPWSSLRVHTPSNVAIGRVGHSLPTSEVLRFGLAHAQARDAVHTALDVDRLSADLTAAGWANLNVHSAADTRHTYLCRPDLGRRLSACSTERLAALAGQAERPPDLCLVIGDGLSAAAFRLGWLIEQAFERRVTGVELKDESGRVALNLPTQVPAGG